MCSLSFICCLSCVLGVLSCLGSQHTHKFSCWLLANTKAALPLCVIYDGELLTFYFAFRTHLYTILKDTGFSDILKFAIYEYHCSVQQMKIGASRG